MPKFMGGKLELNQSMLNHGILLQVDQSNPESIGIAMATTFDIDEDKRIFVAAIAYLVQIYVTAHPDDQLNLQSILDYASNTMGKKLN